MVPVYGTPRRASATGPWSMLRPGPRSALPRDLDWLPLGPADNLELAELIARAEAADNPPYRTTAVETAEYFLDPTYSGVAGRDRAGVMRAFALVRLRPAAELYASVTGVVDPDWRGRGIGRALLHWQTERARHLIGAERAGRSGAAGRGQAGAGHSAAAGVVDGGAPAGSGDAAASDSSTSGESQKAVVTPPLGLAEIASPRKTSRLAAHIVTTVMEGDVEVGEHLAELGFAPTRWFRELRRPLGLEIPRIDLDGFLSIEPWTPELDEAAWRAHNQAWSQGVGSGAMSLEEWRAGRTYFAPRWSFVALDRSGDRGRVAGYLLSSRYEQDWPALGWREGYTDMLGVLADYRSRSVAPALLTAAMRAYAADAMQYAATGVDSDNPTGAVDLYEALGYAPTPGQVLYSLDV